MIKGIGCDMVEHSKSIELGWESNEFCVLERIFTGQELQLNNSKNKIEFLSGRFAAKEAILKCLGSGMVDGLALTDIEVITDQFGKPIIILTGDVEKLAIKMEIRFWHISITHTHTYSLAFVIAEG